MSIQLTNARTEYQHNPLGIGLAAPRFSWEVTSQNRNARQSAYQILAAASPEALNESGASWNTGRVESDATAFIEYAPALAVRERVYWTARAWDESGAATDWLAPQWFETGIQQDDWTGEWIGSSLAGGPKTPVPAPLLRREFSLDKAVKSARLYVTALGIYECEINGQKVGDLAFAPGWTDYRKRVQFQTYDVAALLQPGANAWGALLGDGWYTGRVGWHDRQFFGDRPKLLAQLEIEFQDGSRETIATDGSWKFAFGPILENDIMAGEAYDARQEVKGWSAAGTVADGSVWQNVAVFPAPAIQISEPLGPPVRAAQEITPISKRKEGQAWVYDLGQNMVGVIRIKVFGKAGQTVRLRFAETLEGGPPATEGPLYTTNLRSARCKDYYTLKGEGVEIWEPKFTFHGFRFAELFYIESEVTVEEVTGVVYHSDIAKTGDFSCSDELLNQLQRNIDWGQRGNFLDIPTDCPQRDERLGWTGDAQVFVRTAAWNRDVAGFFTEWARDVRDSQAANGAIPSVVPNIDLGEDGGAAWSDAAIICPWTIYRCYGDVRILKDNYDVFQKFFQNQEDTSIENIRPFHTRDGYGDWLAMDNGDDCLGRTPPDLISSAFFAHEADLMQRIATILGKPEDAAHYGKRFEEIRNSWQRRWITPDGLVASQTQTGYLLALHFNICPPLLRAAMAGQLARDIQKNGNKLTAGFVGSSYLAPVLTETGHLDTAYALLHQTAWPSWLYAVTKNATTIWERWDGWTEDKGFQSAGMNSFNHYAYGAIGEWLYAVVAGIDFDEAKPGYQHIIFRPRPGGTLTSAKAHLKSMRGLISSDWTLEGDAFNWKIQVPSNTSAEIWIPCTEGQSVTESGKSIESAEGLTFVRNEDGAAIYKAGGGTYEFRVA